MDLPSHFLLPIRVFFWFLCNWLCYTLCIANQSFESLDLPFQFLVFLFQLENLFLCLNALLQVVSLDSFQDKNVLLVLLCMAFEFLKLLFCGLGFFGINWTQSWLLCFKYERFFVLLHIWIGRCSSKDLNLLIESLDFESESVVFLLTDQ